ncbi:MAG: preprotein translocase subunit SecG [Candidatus Staskawiczbacteria bacterium RIFOXYB2_FULL_32_9]|uniref:Protein-export membrane protein SecG n=1 Tax=Candidatus Staskawiczbacteria bacterium RIFOXYD1_FULL_32_13 TaxID=1802234 RepID=A0A1G2JMR6_9BACT|nr:MAG: hypothetical protein UR22_C0006G0007 [Parcubacteria group bacterium GW2011_GWC2_32_10]OGZ80413.1 MAG: preprotein translocase subunit SecG [Candidatus Staskawiczbacteria bacterium RIFOXYA2_FULL_32_7]OGZ80877.1 MAG: preprotein translocase subunit SecG [Candidatus Staskawiczbacteria bacterium RIFOXYB1_FULL_32_11]OGZ84268.1 MAG: preprotein translocase subunit SecG [Candidatus Staskawiczbacteria bacterium RIFOXYB2_FULL_32_9]OGZ85869.1 MAG: preprotein translocase subunit SecG [Candidatus Stas
MNQILFYAQIIVSIALIILIAIQQKGTALGSAFGGGGEFYSSRRGAQKNLHYATIVTGALFLILGAINLFIY